MRNDHLGLLTWNMFLNCLRENIECHTYFILTTSITSKIFVYIKDVTLW